MEVQLSGLHSAGGRTAPPAEPGVVPDCWGPWRPELAIGASSAGGLMLPDAMPSAATLYAPRGVWIGTDHVVVCDSGNHRVLIWHSWPAQDGAGADVVLGQPGFTSEGPGAGESGMHLPTGVILEAGRLAVADAWNHRILVWDQLPERHGAPPDHVIGQATLGDAAANRGAEPGAGTLYWPFGIALIDGRFYVADTGNRRVLGWSEGLPLNGQPADLILGQPDAASRDENRGGDPDAHSFRWPHAIASTTDGGVFVADAGNHRVLRWNEHPACDQPADAVIGQPDFSSASEFPYRSQQGHLRFPYALAGADGLAVADTANNRVLIWDRPPLTGAEQPDAALAQRDFAASGENRWEAVAADTLCWPYGLARHGDRLAVADSGNNRVIIWRRGGED